MCLYTVPYTKPIPKIAKSHAQFNSFTDDPHLWMKCSNMEYNYWCVWPFLLNLVRALFVSTEYRIKSLMIEFRMTHSKLIQPYDHIEYRIREKERRKKNCLDNSSIDTVTLWRIVSMAFNRETKHKLTLFWMQWDKNETCI